MNVCEETLEPAHTLVKLRIVIIFKNLVDLHTVEVPGRVEVVDLLGFDCFPD
jgi:hypothetical protein